jgi:hypothetical protein
MPARMSAMNVATSVATLLTTSVALVATIGIACAGPVDETALREYARQERTDRVEMETRRLERLHPDWKPPADLWSARPSGPDEAPLWDLYEAGDLDLLRQAIAQRREQQRDWNPSDDLVEKIKALELRAQILDRAASGKWTEAAQLASDNGLAGGTRDIELLWIVAEAFARTERASEAAALYKFVLENRTDAAERTATILKALGTLSMADAEELIAMGGAGAGGRNEFDDIAWTSPARASARSCTTIPRTRSRRPTWRRSRSSRASHPIRDRRRWWRGTPSNAVNSMPPAIGSNGRSPMAATR